MSKNGKGSKGKSLRDIARERHELTVRSRRELDKLDLVRKSEKLSNESPGDLGGGMDEKGKSSGR